MVEITDNALKVTKKVIEAQKEWMQHKKEIYDETQSTATYNAYLRARDDLYVMCRIMRNLGLEAE